VTATQALLRVSGLRKHFPVRRGLLQRKVGAVQAVDGLDFEVLRGETLSLVGESGCGKTTTALSLVRLLPANAEIVGGSVKLYGIDLVQKSETALRRYRWREIAIVFQGAMNALNPVRRIRDQVAEPLEQRLDVPRREARRRADELLELVGIPRARGSAYPHELSGGMRQRTMIAMALACDPAVIIGDEPTTALDVMVQAQILSLLAELRDEFGLALLLITHDLSVLAQVCDRAAIMYAGRIVEEGYATDLLTTPQHPYTRALVEAFPRVGDRAARKIPVGLPGDPPHPAELPSGCKFHPRCPARFEPCDDIDPALLATAEDRRAACHAVHRDLGITAQ
jgi:peptide/nickel transport system ATP-binding protein